MPEPDKPAADFTPDAFAIRGRLSHCEIGPRPMTRRPKMSCYDPRDPPGTDPLNPPSGPLSGRQLLAIASAALAAWLALFGLAWLLWRGVS